MHGYAGKLLRVNLSAGKAETQALDRRDMMDVAGGRGFGIRQLYDGVNPHIDPLGEENKLLFLTGILTGTAVVAGSRWLACALSPLTGIYGKSCAGGDFGAWLKFAGYDFVVVEGRADRPVYLHVTPEGCEIRDASALWGKKTGETQALLREYHGASTRAACIGPAGENLVRYAAIVTGTRTASRCGMGTVMGSKGLKAIAVSAKRSLNLHDPEGLRQLVKEQVALINANPVYLDHKKLGTTEGSMTRNALGIYPTKNFRYGQMAHHERLSHIEYGKLRTGEFGCYACSARCGKVHAVPQGRPYSGASSEGPEYESYWSFSGPMDSSSIEATIAADQLCDELGMDTISAGGSIGFAYELFEKGLLTTSDTDGLDLTYGNHGTMVALIEKIARREGLGDILAEGTVRAARLIGKGTEVFAMAVKGLELPGYEPRGVKATGFGYATSSIGGSHGNGSLAFQEWGMPVPRAVDRFTEEDKADIVIFNQNGSALGEVGIVCAFARSWGDWYRRLYPAMLKAATGIEEFGDMRYLGMVSERIVALERAFNVRQGVRRKQDTLPVRFLSEPLHTGTAPGEGQMVRGLEAFLDDYYRLRGWTSDGIPSPERLRQLGLEAAAQDMAAIIAKDAD
jgi:aldehyde:ferredoxin oxidoreductase